MKRFLGLLILMVPVCLMATERPNIIMIYADDLGWTDLGCTGSRYYETPNLDALAANGMRFSRAYSDAPVCAPSRGALLSGQLPARTKLTTVFSGKCTADDSLQDISKEFGINNQNLEAKHRHVLTREAVLIPARLKEAGYVTGFIGKWHIGITDGYRPDQRGYDVAIGYYREIDTLFADHYIKNTTDLVNLPNAKKGDWREGLYAEAACEFIEANQDKPFFLSYHSYLTHGPHVGKKELIGKYQKKPKTHQTNPKYASMVEALDESVGKIVAQLTRLNMLDNTLLVFSSDNGGCGGTSNYPLMGAKSFAYEGGYRVPLIVHWPKRIKAGTLNETRVRGVDLYPTFLDAAGASPEAGYTLDGLSLMGELTGSSPLPNRPFYFHYPHYTGTSSPHSIVIADDWKLIRYYNDAEGRFALFNLGDDPEEQQDLSQLNPEKVQLLDRMLQEHLLRGGAEFPIPADSDEGRELIRRFHAGELKGNIKASNLKVKPKNKASEWSAAMGRRKQAEKAENEL